MIPANYPRYSLNCRGTLIDLSMPIVMGILNLTPDSFYDGGKLSGKDAVLRQAGQMLEEGATILDLGGMSSRPGAEIISPKEELKRVLEPIKSVRKKFPEAILSVDTVRSEVALACMEEGAHIINDISAWAFDEKLPEVAAKYKVPYVLMHMKGKPSDMQKQPAYEDVLVEVVDFFSLKVSQLREIGVMDIVLDPGFGFGKSVAHNYSLLNNLDTLRIFDLPVLAGISRKSMICKVLGVNPENALNGSTALHMAALERGARILRVHDVKEAIECIELWKNLKDA